MCVSRSDEEKDMSDPASQATKKRNKRKKKKNASSKMDGGCDSTDKMPKVSWSEIRYCDD